MSKKKIRNYQIFSIIFTFIFGSLLHFTYALSGNNPVVAIFLSINESVWEHLKLLFSPMLLTITIGCFYIGKEVPNFLCSKTIGILVSMAFMVIFFYTYTGILGRNIPAIDITSFFIATILGEFVSYVLIVNKFKCNNVIAITTLIIIFICFIIFTYFTPNIEIFKDPITGQYGFFKLKLNNENFKVVEFDHFKNEADVLKVALFDKFT